MLLFSLFFPLSFPHGPLLFLFPPPVRWPRANLLLSRRRKSPSLFFPLRGEGKRVKTLRLTTLSLKRILLRKKKTFAGQSAPAHLSAQERWIFAAGSPSGREYLLSLAAAAAFADVMDDDDEQDSLGDGEEESFLLSQFVTFFVPSSFPSLFTAWIWRLPTRGMAQKKPKSASCFNTLLRSRWPRRCD